MIKEDYLMLSTKTTSEWRDEAIKQLEEAEKENRRLLTTVFIGACALIFFITALIIAV